MFLVQACPAGALIPKTHRVLVRRGENPKPAGCQLTWRWTPCLLICLPSFHPPFFSFDFFLLINFSLLASPFLFRTYFGSVWNYGWMSMTCCGLFTLLSLALRQAMYQLAPDEKRRDCGLNVLDTYFNNGVRGWLHVRAGEPANADTMSHF